MGSMKNVLLSIAAALMIVLPMAPSHAYLAKYSSGEAYAEPNFRDMTQSFIMMNGFDVAYDEVIDAYAMLYFCDLYKEKYNNDFEWNSIRRKISSNIQAKREYFRNLYEVVSVGYLGRYNFETQDFPLVKRSAMVNVGSIVLFEPEELLPPCIVPDKSKSKFFFPQRYNLLLTHPLTLDRLKMPMDEAESLIARMQKLNNENRSIYMRFRVKLASTVAASVEEPQNRASLIGEIVAIDMFLDRELSQKFASIEVK